MRERWRREARKAEQVEYLRKITIERNSRNFYLAMGLPAYVDDNPQNHLERTRLHLFFLGDFEKEVILGSFGLTETVNFTPSDSPEELSKRMEKPLWLVRATHWYAMEKIQRTRVANLRSDSLV